MNTIKYILALFVALLPFALFAQQKKDSTETISLKEIIVNKIKTVRGTGHMPDVKDGIIYAGKKNEAILVDSLDANKAINNTRQILGQNSWVEYCGIRNRWIYRKRNFDQGA